MARRLDRSAPALAARAPRVASLELGWRARTEKELALMADLVPLLKRLAGGRVSVYEQ